MMNHLVAFMLMVIAAVDTAMAADIGSAPAPNGWCAAASWKRTVTAR